MELRPLRATAVWPLTDLPARLAPLQSRLPLLAARVPAGRPVPLDGDIECLASLDEVAGTHPERTFLLPVEGDSMVDACIHDGDTLVVDRSRQPADGDIVVASLDGDLTVKRLRLRNDLVFLLPENPDYPPVHVDEFCEFAVWGVVTHVLHRVQ